MLISSLSLRSIIWKQECKVGNYREYNFSVRYTSFKHKHTAKLAFVDFIYYQMQMRGKSGCDVYTQNFTRCVPR